MSDQIEGQMSIFDFAEYLPKNTESLEEMTLEQIKDRIEVATGLRFSTGVLQVEDRYYEARPIKNVKVSISLSEFSCGGKGYSEGQKFIGVGIDGKLGGMGSPCNSIDEAVSCIRKHLPRYLEDAKK